MMPGNPKPGTFVANQFSPMDVTLKDTFINNTTTFTATCPPSLWACPLGGCRCSLVFLPPPALIMPVSARGAINTPRQLL